MNPPVLMERIREVPLRPGARITGIVYLLYFLTAVFAVHGSRACGVGRRRGYGEQHPGAPAFI
jgi:hypothetical protein